MNFRPASGCDTAFGTLKSTGICIVNKDQPSNAPLHAHPSPIPLPSSQPQSSQVPQNRMTTISADSNSHPPPAEALQLRPHSSQAAFNSSLPCSQKHQIRTADAYLPSQSSRSQRVLPDSQPRSPQVSQDMVTTMSTDSNNRLRPHSSQAALIRSLPGSQEDQTDEAATYVPSQPHSQCLSSDSQPRSQQYHTINYSTPSSQQLPRRESQCSCSGNRSHSEGFSKPIRYVQDPRVQLDKPSSAYYGSYAGRMVNGTTCLSPSLEITAPDCSQISTRAYPGLLPSPDFGHRPSAFAGNHERPVNAPEDLLDSQLMDSLPLTQMLPPQRVLPFPSRPLRQDADSTPASPTEPPTVKATSTKGKRAKKAQPLKKSESLIVTLPIPSVSATRSRKAKAKANKATSNEVPPSSAPLKRQAAVQRSSENAPSSSAPPRVESIMEAPEYTVTKTSNNLTPPCSRGGDSRRPLSAMSDDQNNQRPSQCSTRDNSPLAQPHHHAQLPEIPPGIQPDEYLTALDDWIRKYHNLPAPAAPKSDKERLAEYAAKPDGERKKIIDNMVLECLQDENFMKLCQDVERSWKRVCLGF